MAFKTRRQHRYERLRASGFLKFEAAQLSKVPFNVPYMQQLIKDRSTEYKKAISGRLSLTKWNRNIIDRYTDNDWLNDKGNPTPWAMLRSYEHPYKEKNPQYDSPWQKKIKKFKDFMDAVEKKLATLPKKPSEWSPEVKAEAERKRTEALMHLKAIRARANQ